MKKLLVAVIIVVVLVAVLGPMVGHWRSGGASNAATTVRVEAVGTGELIEIVSSPGQLQPKTKVSISAKISARIVSLPFDEGATVTKGNPDAKPPVAPSVLVQLDSKDLE